MKRFTLGFWTVVLMCAAACGGGTEPEGPNGGDDGPTQPSVSANAVKLTLQQAEHGTIAASPSGPYQRGAVVQLTATPDAGYGFGGWIGVNGVDNPTSITLSEDITVSAYFAKDAVALSVATSPLEGGSVTIDPPPPYTLGDEVVVTAEPAYGYTFTGWQGASSLDTTLTLVLDNNTSLTAQFARTPAAVSITAQPAAGASIAINPPGPYYVGDSISVSVTVQPGYIFNGWSDGGSELTRTLDLTGDLALVAKVTPVPVLTGPLQHTGNESPYALSWTFAWQSLPQVSAYILEESYNNSAFRTFSTRTTSDTSVIMMVEVDRDAGTHCYRVRARIGSNYSEYSNTHCVQRLPGEKRIRIINDLGSWVGSGGNEYNGIIRVHAGTGDIFLLPNRLENATATLPGGLISVGAQRTFSATSLPENYSIGIAAGWWEYVCINGPCSWDRHLTTVTACDGTSTTYKAEIINITNHDYDTVFIYTSDYLPRGNWGGCQGGTCVKDPLCQ